MHLQSTLLALGATTVAALKPLTISGQNFVDANGNKFQIAGMAYQPGGSAGYNPEEGVDPLGNPDACLRDAALMQILGINTIRVYNLDPNINHDECASIFNAAGMYMILDVNSPLVGEAITSSKPWTSYYAAYLNRTFAIVEAFGNYPNTLGYFSGNEVINDVPSAQYVPPYLRAVTRDLKNYIKNNLKRQIPVGYSAADVRDVLWDTWNYLQCVEDGKDDDMSQVDFFALNSYSWCGPDATFETSTYGDLVKNLESSSVPIFFSEYGCIKPKPRYWNETQALYGAEMDKLFSGGVVYEWTEEDNGYGIVKVDGETATLMGDYSRLRDQFSNIDWETLQATKASDDAPKAPTCKSSLIKIKGFDSNFTLPDVPPGAQTLIDHGIKNKPSGKIVDISDYNVKMAVKDAGGKTLSGLKVVALKNDEVNWPGKNEQDTGDDSNSTSSNGSDGGDDDNEDDGDSAAGFVQPLLWAAAVPLLAMVLA